jgi:glycosyltransferase involved in cell wall biosynthesis
MQSLPSPGFAAPRPVALLHYASAPIVGGVEGILGAHARLLAAHGVAVRTLAGRGGAGTPAQPGAIVPELDSVHPGILECQALMAHGEVPLCFLEWRDRLEALLRRLLDGVGTCFVHNVFTMTKNLPLTAALCALAERGEGPARFVAWTHDLAAINPLYDAEMHPGYPWDLLRRPCPNVLYVAISGERQQEAARLFGVAPETIPVIPNGIGVDEFLPTTPVVTDVVNRLHWAGRELVLLAPVRMTRRKNLEASIRVVAELGRRGNDPLLVITGPGGPHNTKNVEYVADLQQLSRDLGVADHVAMLSLLPTPDGGTLTLDDADTAALYFWADALLFTTQQEGFGLPILEAGLAGLPIFCSDLPVLREVGGPHACYFPPDAPPAAIADQLLGVLDALGPSALRRRVRQWYSWEGIYERQIRPLLV